MLYESPCLSKSPFLWDASNKFIIPGLFYRRGNNDWSAGFPFIPIVIEYRLLILEQGTNARKVNCGCIYST